MADKQQCAGRNKRIKMTLDEATSALDERRKREAKAIAAPLREKRKALQPEAQP